MNNYITKKVSHFKRILKKDRLAVKKTFDFKVVFYKKSDESKPYLTLGANGSVKLDILQIAIAVGCLLLACTTLSLAFKIRRRRRLL